jgi:hypothetical protein
VLRISEPPGFHARLIAETSHEDTANHGRPDHRVVVTLVLPEADLELSDEDLTGIGLTAEEIARSPEIGAWSEDPQIQSGAEYVERLRRASPRYSW